MVLDRSIGTVFGKVSQLYDKYRPGYPDELFKYATKKCKINNNSTVLEIGCGTGIATLQFSEHCSNITAIDISKNMIDLAKEKTNKFNINYVIDSFENAELNNNYFDLIFAAQSFHWVDPNIGYKKVYNLLKNKGWFILFWNYQDHKKNKVLSAVQKLYAEYCHDYFDYTTKKAVDDYLDKLNMFENKIIKRFHWILEFSKEDYIRLINTFGTVVALNEEKRNELMKKIEDLLVNEEEPLKFPYQTVLILARKK